LAAALVGAGALARHSSPIAGHLPCAHLNAKIHTPVSLGKGETERGWSPPSNGERPLLPPPSKGRDLSHTLLEPLGFVETTCSCVPGAPTHLHPSRPHPLGPPLPRAGEGEEKFISGDTPDPGGGVAPCTPDDVNRALGVPTDYPSPPRESEELMVRGLRVRKPIHKPLLVSMNRRV
jgi:hypothetical protein